VERTARARIREMDKTGACSGKNTRRGREKEREIYRKCEGKIEEGEGGRERIRTRTKFQKGIVI